MAPTVRDDMSIGERIAVWRVYRGITQEACAGLVGKSLSWWKKVESGVRRVEKLSDIILIAQVLKVRDLADLTGSMAFPFSVDRSHAHPVLPTVRAALLDASGEPVRRDRPVRTELLRARVDDARAVFHGRRMFVAEVGSLLPGLIADATAELRRAQDLCEHRACAGLLSEIYMLATQVLRHGSAFDLAWIAVDRSMSYAQEADDPLLVGMAAWQLSGVLKDLGRPEEGLAQCQRAIGLIEPMLRRLEETPERVAECLSVWGEVQLQAAQMAGHCSDEGLAMRYWDTGFAAARRVPPDYRYPVTTFDRQRAGVVSVWVRVALGKPRSAITAADRIDISTVPSAPVQSLWLVNVARSYAARRDDVATMHVLLAAERASPETVSANVHVREICRELLRRDRKPISRELHEFARRVGIFT